MSPSKDDRDTYPYRPLGPAPQWTEIAKQILRAYNALAGIVVASTAIIVLYAWLTHEDKPVIEITKPAELIAPVRAGGTLQYRLSFKVHRACDGEIVAVYSSETPGHPALVTQRRPAKYQRPDEYHDVPVVRDLPKEVTPGWWGIVVYRESWCPGEVRHDKITELKFEVLP